jgi:hypothetical protein
MGGERLNGSEVVTRSHERHSSWRTTWRAALDAFLRLVFHDTETRAAKLPPAIRT